MASMLMTCREPRMQAETGVTSVSRRITPVRWAIAARPAAGPAVRCSTVGS